MCQTVTGFCCGRGETQSPVCTRRPCPASSCLGPLSLDLTSSCLCSVLASLPPRLVVRSPSLNQTQHRWGRALPIWASLPLVLPGFFPLFRGQFCSIEAGCSSSPPGLFFASELPPDLLLLRPEAVVTQQSGSPQGVLGAVPAGSWFQITSLGLRGFTGKMGIAPSS